MSHEDRLALLWNFEYDKCMINIRGLPILAVTFLFSFWMPVADATQFKFRLMAEPSSLDWHQASTLIETPMLMNLMEGLMEVDVNLKPKPCLAEKMTISKDQRVYTFKIRKKIKWSDGVDLKAADFFESWKRLLTPSTAAPYAYLLYGIVGGEEFYNGKEKDFSKVGIKVKDEHTLEVTLKKPIAYFPYLAGFCAFPIRKDLIEQLGTQWTKPGKLVSVGPFVLDSYQFQNKIIMKSNPHYWRAHGNVNEVVVQIIKDSATALNVFKAGGLHDGNFCQMI